MQHQSNRPLWIMIGLAAVFILIIMFFISLIADKPTKAELVFKELYQAPPSHRLAPGYHQQLSGILSHAYEAYDGGDYKHAIKLLEAGWEREKDTLSLFFLGISYIEQDKLVHAEDALLSYEQLETDSGLLDRSGYIRFLLAIRMGDKAAAQNVLAGISDKDLASRMEEVLGRPIFDR